MRPFTFSQLADRTWLREQYEDRQKSTLQIAREAGCSPQNINKHLRRCGIPLRLARKLNRQAPEPGPACD